ncbi:MAG TPA: LCCL domain-containing protein [Coleofasciculaceae cyanobacterium]|jgi:hypothetical protein
MKIIKLNSNFKFILASLAIAIGTTSLQPVNAQSSQDGVPEIGWSSKLSSMGLDKADNIGKTYNFYCQPASGDMLHAPVWGTNIYTVNSSICITAVHSGMLSKEGGVVSIELLEGQEFYTGSHKNNVISEDYPSSNLSYTFIGAVANSQDSQPNQPQRRAFGIPKIMVNTLQRGVERSIERAIINLFK